MGARLRQGGLGSEPPARDSRRLLQLRLMLVSLTLTLWGLVIAVRLFQLQVLEHRTYERMALRQSERTIVLDPRRGPILDRDRSALAVSVDAESIHADPQSISDPRRTAQILASTLQLNATERRELTAQLQRDKAFVWVKRKVDPLLAQRVRDLELDGIGFLTESRRYYPRREQAAQVIGYAGMDNTGMWGIEYSLDSTLRGHSAKIVVRTDARRRPYGHRDQPSTDGHTVVLTIDSAIQNSVERELERAVDLTGAQAGMVVVLEPRSGEILALANRPAFNPNRFWAYDSSRWRNRAVTDAFEPGSIFKVITAAAALQERVVNPDEIIDCGQGSIEIANQRINDHAVFDRLSFRDVIAKSSDIGVIRVAQRLGRENMARYARDFGFGALTGVELPGESPGLLRPTSKWSALSLASMSFGQEIGVTALQMALAVGAVANGGYLMKPILVRQVEDNAGRVVKSNKPVAIKRVLEPEVVDVLIELMRGVVLTGTGKQAQVPGYAVAGKTGTAQKVDASGHYSAIDHVASFVGIVPATHPALVILVSLDTPRGQRNQGGDVAAPVFARVAEDSLRRLAVRPDDLTRVIRMAEAPKAGLMPAAYSVPSAPPARVVQDAGHMPDLRGQSAREAAITAARLGLIVEMQGSGRVGSQTPLPGAEIAPGLPCVLTLERAPLLASVPREGGS
jgi:cell division protein FtsI (penicillin-binding protein 3)